MLTLEDRYRHEHMRMRKEVLGFVVQYEIIWENTMTGFLRRILS